MKTKTKTARPRKEDGTFAPMKEYKTPATQEPEQMHQPMQQTNEAAYMAMIAKAASDPNTDIDKFERLIALQEKVLASRALAAYNEAYVRLKPHLPLIIKDNYNTQTKSNYAKIETINKVVEPILGQYGFAVSFETIAQDKDGITIKAILRHEGGHCTETPVWMPYDTKGMAGSVNKTMPHGISSSIMYCRRVGLCMLLNISTGDDKDGNTDADPAKTQNAAFAAKMTPQQASAADEHNADTWDGKIYNEVGKVIAELPKNKEIEFLIPTFTKFLEIRVMSKERLDLINKNIKFISALVDKELGGMVAGFNQLAREGAKDIEELEVVNNDNR